MSYYNLEIEDRKNLGTKAAKSLRREGKIPVNFYYRGQDNVNLSIDRKALYQALHSGQRVFELSLDSETFYAMIKEIQYHPVTEDVIHVDLLRVRRTEKMTFTLPLVLEGDAIGVKEGGLLTQVTIMIEVECLPTKVPENITLDVTELEMNSSMTFADITLEGDMTLITPEDTTIVSVLPPKAEEVEEVLEELEEGELPEGEETPAAADDEDSKQEEASK